jgi:hypothetical protein
MKRQLFEVSDSLETWWQCQQCFRTTISLVGSDYKCVMDGVQSHILRMWATSVCDQIYILLTSQMNLHLSRWAWQSTKAFTSLLHQDFVSWPDLSTVHPIEFKSKIQNLNRDPSAIIACCHGLSRKVWAWFYKYNSIMLLIFKIRYILLSNTLYNLIPKLSKKTLN